MQIVHSLQEYFNKNTFPLFILGNVSVAENKSPRFQFNSPQLVEELLY